MGQCNRTFQPTVADGFSLLLILVENPRKKKIGDHSHDDPAKNNGLMYVISNHPAEEPYSPISMSSE